MKFDKIIEALPYNKSDIYCVLQVGSALYLKNSDDYDFIVIIKEHSPEVDESGTVIVDGKEIDFIHYTPLEWENVMKNQKAYFLTECVDAKCIYGDDKYFKRYDLVKDNQLKNYLLTVYELGLFGKNSFMEKKRLWNFLNFYYKCQNKSHKLKRWQLKEIQNAHDLKLNKEDYRPFLKELKGEISI